jgi:hypothetical protein
MAERVRVFFTSSEYGNDANAAQFGRLMIMGTDEDVRICYGSGGATYTAVCLPVCEALAIMRAIDHAVTYAMHGSEWDIRPSEPAGPAELATLATPQPDRYADQHHEVA